jgi:hypothetical protein
MKPIFLLVEWVFIEMGCHRNGFSSKQVFIEWLFNRMHNFIKFSKLQAEFLLNNTQEEMRWLKFYITYLFMQPNGSIGILY